MMLTRHGPHRSGLPCRVRSAKAFATGFVNQVVLLPLITFAIATFSGLDPVMAAGFVILAACPGGVTSNVLTHFAKEIALSISLTAVVSLLGFITVPFWSFGVEYRESRPSHRRDHRRQCVRAHHHSGGHGAAPLRRGMTQALLWMNRISAGLFAVVVVGAVVRLFVENVPTLGIWTLLLNVAMMGLGFGSAVVLKLDTCATSIALETGVQNATMGIVIATSLLGNEVMSLPSAIYGVLMYLPAFGLIGLLKARGSPSQPERRDWAVCISQGGCRRTAPASAALAGSRPARGHSPCERCPG